MDNSPQKTNTKKGSNAHPYVVLDGRVVEKRNAGIDLDERLAAYGEGWFDTLRSYAGTVADPAGHFGRLRNGARYLGVPMPGKLTSDHQYLQVIRTLLEANRAMDDQTRLRVMVWTGNRDPGYLATSTPDECRFLAVSAPLEDKQPEPVSLAVSSLTRIPHRALPAEVKWTSSMHYILAAREAKEKKDDDALLLTGEGFLSETTIANIFWKKGDRICTPDESCDILPGITRKILIRVLTNSGMTVDEGSFRMRDLEGADLVWLTNSVRGLYPVISIGGKSCAWDEEFWSTLRQLYEENLRSCLQPLPEPMKP